MSAFPILAMLGGDFMPDYNRGEYQVAFKATPGATLRETGDRAQQMVAKLRELPGGRIHLHDDRRSRLAVPAGHRRRHLREAEGALGRHVQRSAARSAREGRTGAGADLRADRSRAFGQKPIQISVRGTDIDELDRMSRALVAAMRQIPGAADIENSLEKSKPELRVNVDRQRASDLGIPVSMIAATMQAGVVGQVATTIQDSVGDNHDVRVRLRADQRRFAEIWRGCRCRRTRTTTTATRS